MSEIETSLRLHEIVNTMLGREGVNALRAYSGPPFDITAPNQHETKKEFLAEKRALEATRKHLEDLSQTLRYTEDDDEIKKKSIDAIREYLVAQGKKAAANTKLNHVLSLALKNALDSDVYFVFLMLSLELQLIITERLSELSDQEKEFWSNSHRAPNYHARTIALRLARIYSRHYQERPTVGTQRDSGAPSTVFTRALEGIFDTLAISSDVRRAASWAVDQLTDEDLKPEPPSLLGGLFGASPAPNFGGATGFGAFMRRAQEEKDPTE